MGFLASLFTGPILSSLVSNLFPAAERIFGQYLNRQISEAEAKAKLGEALGASLADVEKSHSETLTKTYDSFMQAATKSRLLRIGWAAVLFSQLGVLLWHQVGIPAYVHISGVSYPLSGSTVDWAYLLVAACIGLAPVVLRAGPGAGNIADNLKSLTR